MREFVIATDSDVEIPYTFAEKYDMPVFLMPYTVDGKESLFDLGKTTDFDAFYKQLADGAEAATSTRPPSDIEDFFREIAKTGKDILQLSFSSQLSAHFSYCEMAAEIVRKEFPDVRIELVDTLRISVGAGLLVMQAQEMKEDGAGLDEIKTWVLENIGRAHAWFSVDDLGFLKKGGRVSGTAAMVGTILGVKPILKISREGKIVSADKVKGSKNVAKFFVDVVSKYIEEPQTQIVYVAHAGAKQSAQRVAELIGEAVKCKDIQIVDIGPVIGCHTGPGALAVAFMGTACD